MSLFGAAEAMTLQTHTGDTDFQDGVTLLDFQMDANSTYIYLWSCIRACTDNNEVLVETEITRDGARFTLDKHVKDEAGGDYYMVSGMCRINSGASPPTETWKIRHRNVENAGDTSAIDDAVIVALKLDMLDHYGESLGQVDNTTLNYETAFELAFTPFPGEHVIIATCRNWNSQATDDKHEVSLEVDGIATHLARTSLDATSELRTWAAVKYVNFDTDPSSIKIRTRNFSNPATVKTDQHRVAVIRLDRFRWHASVQSMSQPLEALGDGVWHDRMSLIATPETPTEQHLILAGLAQTTNGFFGSRFCNMRLVDMPGSVERWLLRDCHAETTDDLEGTMGLALRVKTLNASTDMRLQAKYNSSLMSGYRVNYPALGLIELREQPALGPLGGDKKQLVVN